MPSVIREQLLNAGISADADSEYAFLGFSK
jgi:hypothetical protein